MSLHLIIPICIFTLALSFCKSINSFVLLATDLDAVNVCLSVIGITA
ncbi:hypothetical protein N4T77_17820 [Clostridium sp. CX1]|nr:hypothetical protein [Clostridium sp. CX1]MCT8978450.1 hypothetical protein [Clostridium sp. CX1]